MFFSLAPMLCSNFLQDLSYEMFEDRHNISCNKCQAEKCLLACLNNSERSIQPVKSTRIGAPLTQISHGQYTMFQ